MVDLEIFTDRIGYQENHVFFGSTYFTYIVTTYKNSLFGISALRCGTIPQYFGAYWNAEHASRLDKNLIHRTISHALK